MLRRALSNLLSNAVRHATVNTAIHVNIKTNTDGISIAMKNIGDAIPVEYLERVFDRFFRVDPARHHGSESNGLGLAITKSIVVAHGGTISASSVNGVTTFTIRLPLAHQDKLLTTL
jgi:two-component system heavy metal sensor histidine kinase CusS